MATDTPAEVRQLTIYQIYPRNHGRNGTLVDVTSDLDRIAALGVDAIYLLPVQPIGLLERKGTLGSPFAISDFRAVNPDLGSEQDFIDLVDKAHTVGLKVILDVVYNHTSPDAPLVNEHPEFYHRNGHGQPVTSVPQWADIIDLAHPHDGLTRYLIDSLAVWVDRGVDGFRCDTAALIPVSFWQQARAELAERTPALLWLAESVHVRMVEDRRARGLPTASDAELYTAFDMEYTYDVWPVWQSAVRGTLPVGRYLEMLRWQDGSLPANYAKLRFVENHDNFRIMTFAPTRSQALAWTALTAFLRGPFMIYAGQESAATHWPSLFDRDPIDWGAYELTDFISALVAVKKHPAVRNGEFRILAAEPVVQLAWGALHGPTLGPVSTNPGLYGVFNIAGTSQNVQVQLPDGTYSDVLAGNLVTIAHGQVAAPATAYLLEFTNAFTETPWDSPLLDVFLHVEYMEDPSDDPVGASARED